MEDVEQLDIRDVAGGVVIAVKAVPGSSRNRVVGVLGDCLKVAVSVPPEKGRANKAIAVVVARAVGVPARRVRVVAGQGGPRKQLHVAGLSARQLREALARL